MIALIGLAFVIVGWVLQFVYMDKKRKIYSSFILFYAIGVIFLIYDGFSSGLISLAIANLLSLIVALAVLLKLKKN